jgi:argininosuccinate lyase
MWSTLTVNRERYARELAGDFLLATEIADYLVERGLPFREAHHVSGRLVRWCEERDTDFRALTPEVLAEHHPLLDAGALAWLEPEAAAERRRSLGGTAWSEIERQIALLRTTL